MPPCLVDACTSNLDLTTPRSPSLSCCLIARVFSWSNNCILWVLFRSLEHLFKHWGLTSSRVSRTVSKFLDEKMLCSLRRCMVCSYCLLFNKVGSYLYTLAYPTQPKPYKRMSSTLLHMRNQIHLTVLSNDLVIHSEILRKMACYLFIISITERNGCSCFRSFNTIICIP